MTEGDTRTRVVILAGTYRIKVHYWGGTPTEDRRGRETLDELLGRLDSARSPAERARVEQLLDRWGDAGAPQTAVHAEAVLFPGTTFERRWRLDTITERAGQLATLGEIEVPAELIRAVRSGAPR